MIKAKRESTIISTSLAEFCGKTCSDTFHGVKVTPHGKNTQQPSTQPDGCGPNQWGPVGYCRFRDEIPETVEGNDDKEGGIKKSQRGGSLPSVHHSGTYCYLRGT